MGTCSPTRSNTHRRIGLDHPLRRPRRRGDPGLDPDTGVGIPSEHLPHIFGLFTQVDRTLDRSQGGLGIGLTSSRRSWRCTAGAFRRRAAARAWGASLPFGLSGLPNLSPRVGTGGRECGPAINRHGEGNRVRILIVDDNGDTWRGLAILLNGHATRSRRHPTVSSAGGQPHFPPGDLSPRHRAARDERLRSGPIRSPG